VNGELIFNNKYIWYKLIDINRDHGHSDHFLYILVSTNTLAVPSDEHVNRISNKGWNLANTTLSECCSIL